MTTDKENPDSAQIGQNISQDVAPQPQVADDSRRRFTKSGLAASGVILTLASRPVLGQWACQSPSGFQSGNVSPHGTPPQCHGLTPGYWGTRGNRWQLPYDPGTCKSGTNCKGMGDWSNGTLFSAAFNCSGYAAGYDGYSMMQVIWMNGHQDRYQLGAHIVAALLNAKSGMTPVLSEQAVKDMFNEWAAKGYYEPTAGVQWSAEDIVTYLKTTMTL